MGLLSTLMAWVYVVAPYIAAIELVFYLFFRWYLLPRANQLVPPAPYRDHGTNRGKLLMKILHRIEETCKMTSRNFDATLQRFLAEWYHVDRTKKTPIESKLLEEENIVDFPDLSLSPVSSPENSDDDDSHQGLDRRIPTSLYKEDIDDFFSWAFFAKHHSAMLPWEVQELEHLYDILDQTHDVSFPSKHAFPTKASRMPSSCRPILMTLEEMNAWHRPLLLYTALYIAKIAGGIVLRMFGYQRVVSSTGLVGWYRPATVDPTKPSTSEGQLLPLLFFHGISPCGFVLYIPYLLFGLATEKDRPVFMFENRAISGALDMSPLTEDQTVDGIVEILDRFQFKNSDLSLVGHSFGSCTITWLAASKKLPSIKQIALLDPVAILLSEPDVMVNFLYSHEMDKIKVFASSEIMTQYFLRRHFAWYNSELWLDDVNSSLLVCLAEQDTIINAGKVKRELDRHASKAKNQTCLFWEGLGHGDCMISPKRWRQIKELMLQQELDIVQGR